MSDFNMKNTVRYARTYRYLQFNKVRTILLLLLVVVPVSAFWVIFCPKITYIIASMGSTVLSPNFPNSAFEIAAVDFSFGYIYYLTTDGILPDILFSLGNFIIAMLVLFGLTFFVKARPVSIFIYIAFLVHICSCLFFIFFPELFPYSLSEYSELYMKQQIGIFICTTFVLGCVTSFLPISPLKAIAAVFGCSAYSFVFAIVRYTTFLFFIKKYSVLYMTCMFFTFGPLIDFLYLVSIYSLVADNASKCLSKHMEVWQW